MTPVPVGFMQNCSVELDFRTVPPFHKRKLADGESAESLSIKRLYVEGEAGFDDSVLRICKGAHRWKWTAFPH